MHRLCRPPEVLTAQLKIAFVILIRDSGQIPPCFWRFLAPTVRY
jgi:hypothetical protein